MSKKLGIVFIIAGMVLCLSALSIFLYNQYENVHAGQKAESLLSDVQNTIRETQDSIISDEYLPPDTPDSEMPITEIDGYGYVGYLLIPDLELELPVMSEWDYNRLKLAPCRHFGSSRTNDLVIAAHNYKNHFGRLSQLDVGDLVVFTDMSGIENIYEVAVVDTLSPTKVELVQNSGYDLVLYTCTNKGDTRITVFCNRQDAT